MPQSSLPLQHLYPALFLPGLLAGGQTTNCGYGINGSGIRDTVRVLGISPTTVIEELRKSRYLKQVNQPLPEQLPEPEAVEVLLQRVDEAGMDVPMLDCIRQKVMPNCLRQEG